MPREKSCVVNMVVRNINICIHIMKPHRTRPLWKRLSNCRQSTWQKNNKIGNWLGSITPMNMRHDKTQEHSLRKYVLQLWPQKVRTVLMTKKTTMLAWNKQKSTFCIVLEDRSPRSRCRGVSPEVFLCFPKLQSAADLWVCPHSYKWDPFIMLFVDG